MLMHRAGVHLCSCIKGRLIGFSTLQRRQDDQKLWSNLTKGCGSGGGSDNEEENCRDRGTTGISAVSTPLLRVVTVGPGLDFKSLLTHSETHCPESLSLKV